MYNITLKFVCFQHSLIDWICMFSSQPQTSLKEPAYDNGLGPYNIDNLKFMQHNVYYRKMSISYGVHSKIGVQIKSLSYFQTIENGDFLPTPCPNCQFRALTPVCSRQRWWLALDSCQSRKVWTTWLGGPSVFDIRYKAHISCHVIHINWLGGVIDLIYRVTW